MTALPNSVEDYSEYGDLFPSVTLDNRVYAISPEHIRHRRRVNALIIDGDNTKDCDDGIYVQSYHGGLVAHISITDVSSLLTPQDPITNEALQRSFTHYLSDGNIPMIPHPLSEGVLSLLGKQVNPTVTISIPFYKNPRTDKFHKGRSNIRLTYIREATRLTYEDATISLYNPYDPNHNVLTHCKNLAHILMREREEKGALGIYNYENGLFITEDGSVLTIDSRFAESQIIIQEFMILANEEIARFALTHNIPLLHRNHKFSRNTDLQKKFDNRSNACYSSYNEGHEGLGIRNYSHCTSPLRRAADFINISNITSYLLKLPFPYDMAKLRNWASHINHKENTMRSSPEPRSPVAETTDIPRLKGKILIRLCNTPYSKEYIKSILNSSEKLDIQDYFALLFDLPTEHFQEIKRNILLRMFSQPYQAPNILQMAVEKFNWQRPDFRTTYTGEGHNKLFRTNASIIIDEVELNSEVIYATKKKSRQFAILCLISHILKVPIPRFQELIPEVRKRGREALISA